MRTVQAAAPMKCALFSTAAALALLAIGAFRLGRSEPPAQPAPPIATPRQRALWSGESLPAVEKKPRPMAASAPEDEAPTEEEALGVGRDSTAVAAAVWQPAIWLCSGSLSSLSWGGPGSDNAHSVTPRTR